MSVLLGEEVDQKKILRAFARHTAKNKHNAFMLEVGAAEMEARASGDWKASREAFQQMQDEFHKASNEAKNASLYVDMVESEFVAPKERITEEMLAEIKDRNATFLGYAYNELNVFRRLEKTPAAMRELVTGFVEQAEKLKEEKPDNLFEALDELMVGLFEKGRRKLAGKKAVDTQ
jgi:AbiV family abortive infection protein